MTVYTGDLDDTLRLSSERAQRTALLAQLRHHVGRVLDKGLSGDEMGERVRLVIDGVDGRLHHIEMDAACAE